MAEKKIQNQANLEALEESMKDAYAEIPDSVLKSFVARAVEDARRIIATNGFSIQELSKELYRAYVTGVAYERANQATQFEQKIAAN